MIKRYILCFWEGISFRILCLDQKDNKCDFVFIQDHGTVDIYTLSLNIEFTEYLQMEQILVSRSVLKLEKFLFQIYKHRDLEFLWGTVSLLSGIYNLPFFTYLLMYLIIHLLVLLDTKTRGFNTVYPVWIYTVNILEPVSKRYLWTSMDLSVSWVLYYTTSVTFAVRAS